MAFVGGFPLTVRSRRRRDFVVAACSSDERVVPSHAQFWTAATDVLRSEGETAKAQLALPKSVAAQILAILESPTSSAASVRVRPDPKSSLARLRGEFETVLAQFEEARNATQGQEFDPAAMGKVYELDAKLGDIENTMQYLEKQVGSDQLGVEVQSNDDENLTLQRVGDEPWEGEQSDEKLGARVERAVRTWVDDVIVKYAVCPYTTSSDIAATGLRSVGVEKGPIGYPVSWATSIECALRDTWVTVERLLATPEDDLSTVLLSFPHLTDVEKFYSFSLVLAEQVRISGAASHFGIVFFHPEYDRAHASLPSRAPVSGHLPGAPFLKAYISRDNECEDEKKLAEQVTAANYARRAPVPMVNVLRADQVQKAETLSLKGTIYARNAVRLEEAGGEQLQQILDRLKATVESNRKDMGQKV